MFVTGTKAACECKQDELDDSGESDESGQEEGFESSVANEVDGLSTLNVEERVPESMVDIQNNEEENANNEAENANNEEENANNEKESMSKEDDKVIKNSENIQPKPKKRKRKLLKVL